MYNGIGLQTARGTGTNGYVQTNLSNLLLSKKRVEYNSEADLRRAEAELNRPPNEDILQHQRKRVIEMKCVEFEMLMEEKGFDDEEILKKVTDYRNLLLSQLESGELNLDSELDSRDSHARAKAAVQNRDRMKNALGLDKDFVPGTSMKSMKKSDVVGAALAPSVQKTEESLLSTLKTQLKEKSAKDKKRKKRRQESTSSSSSDGDSSDSSDDSSEDSSSSDDSSDSSSEESVKHKKTKKRQAEKKQPVERERRDKRGRRDENEHVPKRRREHERVEKRRKSRSPSESSRRKKTNNSHDEDRRRRSSSSEGHKERSKKRGRSHERSSPRKVKKEPPSPPSGEESRHKEGQSVPIGSIESRRDTYSDESSDSDSNDSLKYKMKSTVSIVQK